MRRKKRGKPKDEIFVVSASDATDKKATVLPTLEEFDTDEYDEIECPFEDEINAYYEKKQQIAVDFNADMVSPSKKKRLNRN